MRRLAYFVLVLLALALLAGDALACSVCFGKSDSPMVRGAELSVLFMASLTYLMIGGGLASFIILRRRASRSDAGEEDGSS